MDYEKTLETVKQMVKDGQVSQETAELYFPELKESKDEKVRKAIHIYLDGLDGRKDCAPKGEYSIKDMIAWLEKQWSESNDVVKCLINGMKFYYEDNPEATWGTEKFSMKVKDILSWLEKHNQIMTKSPQLGEQEPAETANRSPQEESNPNKKPQRIVSAETKEAMYDKPWSEEDEINLEGIIAEIEANKNQAPDYDRATYDRFLSWLKSLRPQNRWKPSDEQLEALRIAAEIGTANNSWAMDVLKCVYQYLKKLREE